MSLDVFIIGCVALLSVLIFSNLCAYKFGKYQGWTEVLRKSTQQEKESIALKKGETLMAVVDTKKGKYFFIGVDARKELNYE
jgi:hypothetical protein